MGCRKFSKLIGSEERCDRISTNVFLIDIVSKPSKARGEVRFKVFDPSRNVD